MTTDNKIYDVMVIGSGFAGMAAAAFAVKAGLNVVQTGATGGIDFSTGFIDLMGVHPMSEGKRWKKSVAGNRSHAQGSSEASVRVSFR